MSVQYLYQLTWTGVILGVSLFLAGHYSHRFFSSWIIAYFFFFITAGLDIVSWVFGRTSFLALTAAAVAILTMSLSCYFLIEVGSVVRQHSHPRKLAIGFSIAAFGTGLAILMNSRSHVFALVPVMVLTSACLVHVGIAFFSIVPSAGWRSIAWWLGIGFIAKGLWFFTYPIGMNSPLENLVYWMDGTIQIFISLVMIVYLLERRTNEFQMLIDSNPKHAFYMVDPTGLIQSWNKSAQALTGFEPKDVIGKPLSLLGVSAEGQRNLDKVIEHDPSDGPQEVDCWQRRKNGRHYWAETTLSPVEHAPGVHCGWAVLTRDMTERMELETERNRLGKVVEQSEESIVIADPDGTIRYTNPAFEKITERQHLIGSPIWKIVNDETALEIQRTVERGSSWKGRIQTARFDQAPLIENAGLSPIRDAGGRITNLVMLLHDTTRETELQEQLRHAQKMEDIGRLAGGVAHDFGNLLQIIICYNHMLKINQRSDQVLQNSCKTISRAANRGKVLIQQLLSFSRKKTPEVVLLDLNSAVSQLVSMLRRLVDKQISLITRLAETPVVVKIDPGLFDQVLLNLINNAQHAIPSVGQIIIEVRTVLKEDETSAVLSVHDNGIGMDTKTKEKIFKPFFTTKPASIGTGLGLSIVAEIVREANGIIEVESELGKGTSFHISLPMQSQKASTN